MTLTPDIKRTLMAQETGEREVCLLTITHPEFDQPAYLSTDPTEYLRDDEDTNTPIYGTRSRGKEFIFLPISATLPGSDSENSPAGTFSISNVSQLLAPYLITINDQYPKVNIDVVMASDPDTIIQTWPEMDLTTANIDVNAAEVQVSLNMSNTEPVPWLRFVPAYFPNLFM